MHWDPRPAGGTLTDLDQGELNSARGPSYATQSPPEVNSKLLTF